MYLDYFGLKEKPFGLTPDTRFVFLSNNHREAFAHLWYGLHQGGGFIVLTGEVGTGKTTLLRALLSRLNSDKWRSALVFYPDLSSAGLFREILREFGLPAESKDPGRLMHTLNTYLLGENASGRSVLLIIDEAQNLQPQVLEKIRLLSNLETESRKLLHIVLAGQPELRRKLDRQDLRQLKQRISVKYHLRGMNAVNTSRYVAHRLKRAGGRPALFSASALKSVYRISLGIPRVINILCDRCLLEAFVGNRRIITPRTVARAKKEFKAPRRYPLRFPGKGIMRIFPPGFLLLGLVGLGLSQFHFPAPDSAVVNKSRGETTAYVDETESPVPSEVAAEGLVETTGNRNAFNALARAWQVPMLAAEEGVAEMGGLWQAARNRGLEVSGVRGRLADVLGLNYPLLIRVRGKAGLEVVTVLEERQGKFRIVPAVESRTWMTSAELGQLWNGEAILFWRNDLKLSKGFQAAAGKGEVRALQELLSAAGEDRISTDGVFGRETDQALRAFQRRQGLESAPAEHFGMTTLLRLYQNSGRFYVPRLREG